MALSASTPAQRYELINACNNLTKVCHKFEEDGYLATGNTALMTKLQAAITRVQTALTAIADAA